MAYKDPNDPRAKESRRRHYEKNRDRYKQNAKKNRSSLAAMVNEYKSNHCSDCGGEFPLCCMDFHHRDPDTKVDRVANMVALGLSRDRIRSEIAKCDLLCANCHRIRHSKAMA